MIAETPEKSRILVADDDEIALGVLKATLEPEFSVRCLDRSQDVLPALHDQVADLVVLDVEMPGQDGYTVCRHLREASDLGDLPIVFLSAHADIHERLRGYEAGGDDYLVKPFDPQELRAKIARLVQQHAREREREHAFSGQLDELTATVLSSADMVGEAGVVLDFQRSLMHCIDVQGVARALLQALGRYGLEGCVRIADGAGSSVSLNGRTFSCTALEMSLLDHLQASRGPSSIRPFGQHTGFCYGRVLLFVRDLCMDRPDGMDRATAERMGRLIDNVALLIEGALSRLGALEAQGARRELDATRTVVAITRDALADISARGHAQRMQTRQVFEHLSERLEEAYIHLGLTSAQEDLINELVREHSQRAQDILNDSQRLEQKLCEVIRNLSSNG